MLGALRAEWEGVGEGREVMSRKKATLGEVVRIWIVVASRLTALAAVAGSRDAHVSRRIDSDGHSFSQPGLPATTFLFRPPPPRLVYSPVPGHRCLSPRAALPCPLHYFRGGHDAPESQPAHSSEPRATGRLGVVDLPSKFHRPVWQISAAPPARALAPQLHPRNIHPATDLVSLLSRRPMCPTHSSVRPSTPEPLATPRPPTRRPSQKSIRGLHRESARAVPLPNALTTLAVRPGVCGTAVYLGMTLHHLNSRRSRTPSSMRAISVRVPPSLVSNSPPTPRQRSSASGAAPVVPFLPWCHTSAHAAWYVRADQPLL